MQPTVGYRIPAGIEVKQNSCKVFDFELTSQSCATTWRLCASIVHMCEKSLRQQRSLFTGAEGLRRTAITSECDPLITSNYNH